MRPIILSCNTGEGHNSAARAVKEQFEKQGIECPILDALAFTSERISRLVCTFYIKTANTAPKLVGVCYHACEDISGTGVRSLFYIANMIYAKTLYKYIEDNNIDTVVTTHLFPALCLTHIRKKYKANFKMYFICTDYTCYPHTEEVQSDIMFIGHEAMIPDFVKRGVNADILYPSGIPTCEKFAHKVPKDEAREALGLPKGVPIIMVMGGSLGFGEIEETASHLMKLMSDDTHVVVLGGNNEEMKAHLRRVYKDDPRVHIQDYTNQTDLFMDACDVIMTKPGGLTSTEAAVKNIPIVHTLAIPGIESNNVKLFSGRGMSVSGSTNMETVERALELVASPEKRAAMTEAQKKNINPRAAEDIVRLIKEKSEL